MEEANKGHASAYGEDIWTDKASDKVRELFEIDCEVFFTFNGTAANSLSLSHLCQSYHSIICSNVSHIETDECGGPEFFSNGTKILLTPHRQGKVTPAEVERLVKHRSDIHYPKPQAVSITQSTEVGTVYAVDELQALSEAARRCHLKVHMDGARFANAAVTLGLSPKDITWKAGVDVLCFGGTKNGMAVGDMVVFFDKDMAHEFDYRCKQSGQLASKMRYLAAPWLGLLERGRWLANARNANTRALSLYKKMEKIKDIKLLFPCQANAVFAKLPTAMTSALKQKGWHFYDFIGAGGARFMCSWDTKESDVEALVRDMKSS
jgi:threonine aldolase